MDSVDFHFVTESIEDAVGGPKAFAHPCVENEAQFSGVGVLKQAMGSSRIEASHEIDHMIAGAKGDRNGD